MGTYDQYLPRGLLPGPMMLGATPPAGAPIEAPLPVPVAQPQRMGPPPPAQLPPMQWTPEAVMRAQEELAKRMSGNPVVIGKGALGGAVNFGNGRMSTLPISLAQMKAADNERMRQDAVKAAMGETTPEGFAAALAGVPDYAKLAIEQRMRSMDPATQLDLKSKQLAYENAQA